MPLQADVSVVIPAYNAEAFVVDALDSIEGQSLHPRQVLVVDDGSKDNTSAVVQAWIDSHATSYPVLLLRQKNGGISVARNSAIRRSSANWIALLDADDIWLPEHLASLMSAISASPGSIAAYGAGKIFRGSAIEDLPYDDFWDNPSKKFGEAIAGTPMLKIDRRALLRLLRGNFIKPSSLILSKSALEKWGMFDEEQGNAEDRELLARLLIYGTFVYCPSAITLYRWHDDNASQGKNAKRNLEFGLRAVKSIEGRFSEFLTPDERQAIKIILREAASQYADICAMRGVGALYLGGTFLRWQLGLGAAALSATPKRVAKSLWASARRRLAVD